MAKHVEVNMGDCSRCEGCLELCPKVFSMNDAGYIEVVNPVPSDEEACVNEAIKFCPEDCISWESDDES